MTLPLVTVIIPTRNRPAPLQRALASVFSQEGAGVQFEMEVFVVDDGSLDPSPELGCLYPKLYRIRLDTPRGAAAARNIGIRASRGSYLAFLDDDDVWLPHKLRQQLAALENAPAAAMVYSPVINCLPDGRQFVWPGNDAPAGSIFPLLVMHNYCGTPMNVLVRRDPVETVGFFDERLPTAEDYDLWLRLAFNSPIEFVAGPVAVHLRSRDGKYSRNLVNGAPGSSTRYLTERAVLERALALMQDIADDAEIKQQARAGLEVRIAGALADLDELTLTRAQIITALERCPQLLRYRWARASIVRLASLATRDTPIEQIIAFCEELMAAGRRPGIVDRMLRRHIAASVWCTVGIGLARNRRFDVAGYAFARAIYQNPIPLIWGTVRVLWKHMPGRGQQHEDSQHPDPSDRHPFKLGVR